MHLPLVPARPSPRMGDERLVYERSTLTTLKRIMIHLLIQKVSPWIRLARLRLDGFPPLHHLPDLVDVSTR